MVAAAAAEDLEIPPAAKRKDGKGELVLPVGLPDTGYFDWVDKFLAENPEFVELSDRKILASSSAQLFLSLAFVPLCTVSAF